MNEELLYLVKGIKIKLEDDEDDDDEDDDDDEYMKLTKKEMIREIEHEYNWFGRFLLNLKSTKKIGQLLGDYIRDSEV